MNNLGLRSIAELNSSMHGTTLVASTSVVPWHVLTSMCIVHDGHWQLVSLN